MFRERLDSIAKILSGIHEEIRARNQEQDPSSKQSVPNLSSITDAMSDFQNKYHHAPQK